ncbi:MAG TPA: hypothetical protein DCE11_04860 [Ruminiclostridium sp.]|nr:hypothetical protein [Ruminiclostridium sp.]
MRLSNVDFKKSILMIFLFLLCFFQMGILWSEKNPGVLFSFSHSVRGNDFVDINEVKENYYRPKEILISSGKGDLYWKLDSKSNLYRSIWNDFKDSYLSQIIQSKPSIRDKDYEQSWEYLSRMKSIIVEFGYEIPSGVIQWMENLDTASLSAIPNIYKIAIHPSEDINNGKNTLYVYDGSNVYKYVVTIKQGNMKKEDYIKAIETAAENEFVVPMNRLITYNPITEQRELLVCLSDEERKIWDLLLTTPDRIVLKKDNIETVQDYLLDEYKGSMVSKWSEDGTNIIFSDPEKVYRYYNNGLLEYQNRYKEAVDKGRVEEALAEALTFIEYRRRDLIEGADIILSDISDKGRYYAFTFDYIVDDMKVKVLRTRTGTVEPAIVINAVKDRVLDAKWYIKTFANNDYSNVYNMSFFRFYERQFIREYPDLRNKPVILDVSNEYLFSDIGTRAEPFWLIETNSNQLIFVGMQGKE